MKIVQMTEAEYRALPAMNATALACLADATPAHWSHEIANNRRTPAMEIGIALHCAVLEPDEFAAHYAVPPDCDRRTTVGKAAWAAFQDANEGKTHLTAEDYGIVMGMAASIHRHPEASRWLNVCEMREVCIVGELGGIPAKCRLDMLDQNSGLMADIKSTRHRATRSECEMAAWRLNYFLRLAFYKRMMEAVGLPWNGCSTIWVESKPPHCVNVLPVADTSIVLMQRSLDRAINTYRDWIRDPTEGWPMTATELGLPSWVATSLEIEDH